MIKLLIATMSGALVMLSLSNAQATTAAFQNAEMFDLATGEDVDGGGTLTRTEDAIQVQIAMAGLDKDSAYTMWWIVFNNPAACLGTCGSDDFGNEIVEAGAFYAAGFVTGTDGSANISARLDAGDLPDGLDSLLATRQGLNPGNGHDAEIHLVMRTHGRTVVGAVGEQVGTFGGECEPMPGFDGCQNQRAIIFLPIGD